MTETTEMHPETDSLFNMYVNLAEGGAEVSVIVALQGLIITGLLVSSDRFLEELQSHQRRSGEAGIQLADAFERARAEAQALLEEAEAERENGGQEEAESDQKRRKFFHLVDATIRSGPATYNARLWRGRVASVNGFTLGTIQ